MTWGFNSRKKAEGLSRLADQTFAGYSGKNTYDRRYEYIVRVPSGGISARTSTTPGMSSCEIYQIEQDGQLSQEQVITGGLTRDVYNISETEVVDPGAEIVLLPAIEVSGKIVVIPEEGDAGKRGAIRFRVLSRVSDGVYSAVVMQTDPGSGLDVGDPVEVTDPPNIFSALVRADQQVAGQQVGSTGTAMRVNEVWHIIEATMPIDRMRMQLKDCLLATDENATVFVKQVDLKAQGYPDVDLPAELVASSDVAYGDWEISQALNQYDLHAVQDSFVTVQRVSDAVWSDGLSITTPNTGGEQSPEWEIVAVEEPIANWVTATFQGGNFQLARFWEGADPSTCVGLGPYIRGNCVFDCSCIDDGELLIGCYNPEANQYEFFASQSALLGSPVAKQIPKLGDGSSPSTSTDCDTSSPDGPQYCITQEVETAYVFECGLPPVEPATVPLVCIGQDIFSCLDLCQWICDNCTWINYSVAEQCDPPPCTETCTYEANQISSDPPVFEWFLPESSDCTEPGCVCPPPPSSPPTSIDDVITYNCGDDPPPSEGCNWQLDAGTDVASFSAEYDNTPCGNVGITLLDGGSLLGNSIEFTVRISSGGCQKQEDVFASAVPYYDAVNDCCYVEVTINTPIDPDLSQDFPVGPIQFPGCTGASVPAACTPPPDCPCDTGGFNTATIVINTNESQCQPIALVAMETPMGMKSKAPQTDGERFVSENPALFRSGCGSCRRETIRVIDRWSGKKPTLQQVGILSSTIHSKNRKTPLYDIVETLVKFMGMEDETP